MDLDIEQLQTVEHAIRESWSHDTAWDPKTWTAEAPESGQCWSTAYVLRGLFGGEIVHAEVFPRVCRKNTTLGTALVMEPSST